MIGTATSVSAWLSSQSHIETNCLLNLKPSISNAGTEKAIEPGKMRSEDDTFERDL